MWNLTIINHIINANLCIDFSTHFAVLCLPECSARCMCYYTSTEFLHQFKPMDVLTCVCLHAITIIMQYDHRDYNKSQVKLAVYCDQ